MRAHWIFVAALTAAGCGPSGDRPSGDRDAERNRDAERASTSSEPAPSASAAAPVFKAPAAPAAGPAYLATSEGVAVIDAAGAATTVKGLDGMKSAVLTLGADGKPYCMASSPSVGGKDIFELVGATARKIAHTESPGMVLAVSKAGTLHVAERRPTRVLDYAAGKWTESPVPGLDDELEILYADSKDRLWAATRKAVMLREGGAWKKLAIDKLDGTAAIGELGDALIVVADSGLYRVDAAGVATPDEGYSSPTAQPTFSPAGLLAIAQTVGATSSPNSGKPGVRLVDASKAVKDVPVEMGSAYVDGSARVWAIEDGALEILDTATGTKTVYPVGTIPALAAWFAERRDGVLVIGGGPRLAPPAAVEKAKSVSGSLLRGSAPLANVEVEICVEPWTLSSSSPCVGRASRLVTKTNDKGEFTFADVPVATYALGFKEGEEWKVRLGATIDKLTPGATKTLPPIVFAAD